MGETADLQDAKGLIRESYRIANITASECRSIFLDWALSVPDGSDTHQALKDIAAHYTPANPDHPMSKILNEGLLQMQQPRRRGGWKSRERN